MSENQGNNSDKKRSELTEEDIQALIKSPFEKKIDITKKMADYYSKGGFDAKQIESAARIFRTLVQDAEVKVRKTLSEAIKDHADIPKDIVVALANDVQEVSLPVLEFSDLLSDIDLIEIVSSTEDVEKQKSISRRKNVSENLSEALVDTGNSDVVETLLNNSGAVVSEETFNHIVEDFGDSEKVIGAMIQRESLPVSIIENLTDTISEKIYNKVMEKHPEAMENLHKTIKTSREVAKMKVMGLRSTDAVYYQFCQLMEKLRISEELAPIYALCMSNLDIFEVMVARSTKTPVLNVRMLVADNSNKGFKVLYQRAGLPADLYDAAEILITVLRDMGNGIERSGVYATKETAAKIIQEIDNRVPDIKSVKNLDFILSLVNHHSVVADSMNE